MSPHPKRTARGKRIEQAAPEVAAHLRGETVPGLREYALRVPEAVDVAGIRAALGRSQAAFAARFGVVPISVGNGGAALPTLSR